MQINALKMERVKIFSCALFIFGSRLNCVVSVTFRPLCTRYLSDTRLRTPHCRLEIFIALKRIPLTPSDNWTQALLSFRPYQRHCSGEVSPLKVSS